MQKRSLGKVAAALLLVLGGCASTPPPTNQPRQHMIDLMPAHQAWWASAATLDQNSQIRLLREMVVERYPDVYTKGVLKFDPVTGLDEWYPRWYGWVSPGMSRINTLAASLPSTVPAIEKRFRREFPEFVFDGDIYFMNAIGAFDGAVRNVKGRRSLLFGLDVISAIYGEQAAIEPLFDHEFFHLYHEKHFRSGSDDTPAPLWHALWREGLATYVARRMNRGASDLQIFGLPESTPSRVEQRRTQFAKDFLAKMNSTSEEDYAAFFLGNSPTSNPPSRSGYYLGYLLAERIGRSLTLDHLAKLPAETVRLRIDEELQAMARE